MTAARLLDPEVSLARVVEEARIGGDDERLALQRRLVMVLERLDFNILDPYEDRLHAARTLAVELLR
jgi:hypothetical protein